MMRNRAETAVLVVLHGMGQQALEEPIHLSGSSDADALRAVDRLDRFGEIAMRGTGAEYHIALSEGGTR